jgi:hypothetical protein
MKQAYRLLLSFIFISTIINAQMRGPMEEPYIPGQLIVQIDQNVKIESLIKDLPANYNFSVDRELSRIMRAWLLKFDVNEIPQEEALRLMKGIDGFTVVQNNHVIEMRNTPNDPNYNQQWHHNNTGQGGGTTGADIQIEDAWAITTGGQNANGDDIVVCILEGVDFSHGDLVDNHWVNTAEIPGNGVDDDGNGYIDDINGWNVGNNSGNLNTQATGHGTNVAGMIGATGNNNVGVVGANWDVKMMNVIGYNVGSEASVVSAYEYPLVQRQLYNNSNGAQGSFVVSTNASWGIDGANPNNYPIWCAFYDTLGKYGILNCGATTNSNLNVDVSGDMPTACGSQYMVGVGRSDRNDGFQGGYGATTINFAAPGVQVVTTANGNGYTSTTGTSFASPLTAGVIALLYSIPCPEFATLATNQPQAAADFVFNALMDGCEPQPAMQGNFVTDGRLNAFNAMTLLMDNVCGACSAPLDVSISNEGADEVSINFSPVTDALLYNVKIRPVGSSTWDEFSTSNTNYTFTGLDSCTEYEIVVQTECDGEESNDSQILTAQTGDCGACIDLTYCAPSVTNPDPRISIHSPQSLANIITDYTETSGWGAPFDEGYNYGDFVLVDDGSANPEEGCDPLINGADISGNIAVVRRGTCNFSVKALNAQDAGATAVIIVNNQAQGLQQLGAGTAANQVDIPVVMISQNDGTDLITALSNGDEVVGLAGAQNEYIEDFQLGVDVYNTGDDDGYLEAGLYHQIFFLDQGVNFEMTPGFDGQDLPLQTRIWIDLNQDGSYDQNEIVYDQSAPSFGVHAASFTVPNNAAIGSTRLRVQTVYQGPDANSLPDACSNFTSGEVEDYCIELREGVASINAYNDQQFNIYPNPANEMLNVKAPNSEAAQIVMFDPTGKLVMSVPTNGEITQLNMSALESGIYITKIVSEAGIILHVGRVSVQK